MLFSTQDHDQNFHSCLTAEMHLVAIACHSLFTGCRFCQMMWRLNFLVVFTCIVMRNDYMLYYICPMHTIFTVRSLRHSDELLQTISNHCLGSVHRTACM